MKPEDIKVEISGGLANQIFMLLGGKWISDQKAKKLTLVYFPGPIHSESLLDFNLPYKITKYNGIYRFALRALRKFSKLNGNIESLLTKLGVLFVKEVGYPDKNFVKKNIWYFSGYCQSYLIHRQVLQGNSVFKILEYEPKTWTSGYVNNVIDKNDIAIHVRLGDYTNEIDSIGLVGLNYYKESIKIALEKGGTGKIRVLTNDLQECMEFLAPLSHKFEFVKVPEDIPNFDFLYILSKHRFLILSNSSFSLLAGLESRDSTVIRPTPWFKNLEEPEKLSPHEWISVSSSWR